MVDEGDDVSERIQYCEDCGREIYWDEKAGDFRHKTEPERGCFLIAGEYQRTPQQEQELEVMRSRGEI